MRGLRRSLRAMQRGERNLAALLVVSYSLALYGLYLLKPARDSLFLSSQSAADLPLAFVLTAVVAIPVALAYSRASRSWGLGTLLVAVSVVVVLGLLGWRLWLASSSSIAQYLFYAWAGTIGGLVTSQFWLIGNAVCDAVQAKRLFPLLSLGGIVGAVLGGWSSGVLAERLGLGALDLIVAAAVVWAVALGTAALTLRLESRTDASVRQPPRAVDRGARSLLRSVTGSRHLMLIIGLVAVSMMVSTFADFLFKTAVTAAHPSPEALLSFLGIFYAALNVVSLALQALLTTRIFRAVGVGGALLVLPVILTLGAASLLVVPGLLAATLLRGGEMGLKHSLDKTSRELLYLPVPLSLKRRVKVLVDTFVERGSRGLAGVALLVTTSVLQLSFRMTTVVLLVLIAVWLALAIAMRRQYIQNFRGAVARREVDRDDLQLDLRDPRAIATVTPLLTSNNPREVGYGLAMLQDASREDLPPIVAELVDHPVAAVRQRALVLVTEAGVADLGARVEPLLASDDAETGRLAAGYLHRHGEQRSLVRAVERGSAARSSVLEYLAFLPAAQELPDLVATIDLPALLAEAPSEPERHRAAVAACMGRTWTRDAEDLLRDLAPHPLAIQGAALVALGRQRDRRRLATVGGWLSHAGLRPWARRALLIYGPLAVSLLLDLGTRATLDLATRRAALSALAGIPYQRTVDAVISHLRDATDADRAALVPVLFRLRERRPTLRFSRHAVERILRREVTAAQHLVHLTAQLGPSSPESAERLLRRSLAEARRHRLERVFRLLALHYDLQDIMGAWGRFDSPILSRRADAREFLENLLAPHHKALLQGLDRPRTRQRRPDRVAALRELMQVDDIWLRCCAVWAAAAESQQPLRNEIGTLCNHPSPLVAETARVALDDGRRTGTMLTTIEKVVLLERVEHFDAVDSVQLAAIASIAEEVVCAAEDMVYRTGDAGDAMYLVVDGAIGLERGEQEIARAEAGQAFGAWALFEAEPRLTSAVARRECRLLRVDRDDFADLMAEDVEVARSMLRSIARRLRMLASQAA